MPEKKKTPAAKMDDKRSAKTPTVRARGPEPARGGDAAQALGAAEQFSAFEAAMKQFHGRHLAKARKVR